MSDHFQSSISFRKDGKFVGGYIFHQPNEHTAWEREQVIYPGGSVRCGHTMRVVEGTK